MATTCKLIAKSVLGASAANVEFTSIPATYTDLLLMSTTRSDRGGVGNGKIIVTFNASTSGYSYRTIRGSGSAASSSSASSLSGLDVSAFTATSAGQTSNTFSSTEVYVPNYAGSSNKSVSSTTVGENNATEAYMLAIAGLWADTSAISSLKVAEESGYNFVSGSSFFLYGITKA
jgi:hypothetical protein